MKSPKITTKSNAQKQMVNSSFGLNFMTLNILNLNFFHISWIHHELEGIILKKLNNYQFNINLMYDEQILDNYLFNITYLHTNYNIF